MQEPAITPTATLAVAGTPTHAAWQLPCRGVRRRTRPKPKRCMRRPHLRPNSYQPSNKPPSRLCNSKPSRSKPHPPSNRPCSNTCRSQPRKLRLQTRCRLRYSKSWLGSCSRRARAPRQWPRFALKSSFTMMPTEASGDSPCPASNSVQTGS